MTNLLNSFKYVIIALKPTAIHKIVATRRLQKWCAVLWLYHSILANASGHLDWSLKTRVVTILRSGISFNSRHSQQLHARAQFICTCREISHSPSWYRQRWHIHSPHYCFLSDDGNMLQQDYAFLPSVSGDDINVQNHSQLHTSGIGAIKSSQ